MKHWKNNTSNNLILGDGWNKDWSLFTPPPHPWRQQKSPARGHFSRNILFMIFSKVIKENQKSHR